MSTRISFIDNLKGVLILLVVVGHLNGYIDTSDCKLAVAISNWIYTFHMPLFLFCSGLFVARQFQNGSWEGVLTNALTFYVLYILFYCSKYVISFVCGGDPSFNPLYINAGSWYLFVLATFLLVSPALSQMKMSWALVLALLLSVASCLLNEDRTFLSSSRFFTYLPWFVAGYYCTGDRLNKYRLGCRSMPVQAKAAIAIVSLVILTGYLLALYQVFPPEVVTLDRKLSTGLHSIDDIGWAFGAEGVMFLPVLGLCRVVHYALVAVLCVAIAILTPVDSCFLTKWGKNSLQVYIVHLLLLYVVDGVCGLDYFGQLFGLLGDWWAVLFPIIGGFVVTAVLAVPDFPNRAVAALKRSIRGGLLVLHSS